MERSSYIRVKMNFSIKKTIKSVPFFARAINTCHCLRETAQIIREQNYYEQAAKKRGLILDYSFENLKRRLKENLAGRSIIVEKNAGKRPHIVYASRPVPWDKHNMAPAIAKLADLSTYFYSERGFNKFDPDWARIREAMNRDFFNYVCDLHKKKPIDLILTYLSGGEISPGIIEAIKNLGIVITTIHMDDRLSFKGAKQGGWWSGPYAVAKSYDLNLTQAPESLVKYSVEGALAALFPLAANEELFYPRDTGFNYDVSFVGTSHGERKFFINYLRKNGINVAAFGKGWENGFVPSEKIPEIYSASRINLSFGDISFTNLQCMKARDFEIPMSGGLMLTTFNPHLSNYYEFEKQVFTFKTREECVSKIKMLLQNPELCREARISARQRSLSEHTLTARIRFLLDLVGY
jgi:hypothetical protein